MSRLSNRPPSSFVPQPSADPLSPFFFTGFSRLLYWTFFKPSSYDGYIRSILGADADKEGWGNFRAALRRPHIRRFLLQNLFLVIAISALTTAALNVAFNPASVDLPRVLRGVAFGVAFGVTGGMAGGVA